MKRITVIGILLLVVGMLAVPSSALTWETYLEDIAVNSGTTDIDVDINATGHDNVSTAGDYYNISLPCNITNLNATGFVNVTCNCTAGLNINLSINNALIINDVVVNASGWYNMTSDTTVVAPGLGPYNDTWDMMENLSGNDRWLNFTYNSTNGDLNVTVTIYADDVALYWGWLNTSVVTTEAFLSTPEIEDAQAHSYFAVRDKIKVTNNLGYNLTNILLNMTYATQAITEPHANYNITALASTGYVSVNNHTENYSKYGPYVFGKPVEDIDEDDHEVRIKAKSHEVLSRAVDWDFDETAEDYEDYFVTIDYDTLEVRLNNVKIDWEEGTIEMEDMSLTDGLNTFEFTWTEAEVPPVPPVPVPWEWLLEDYGTGIALWLWFVITAVVIGVIAVVVYTVRKK